MQTMVAQLAVADFILASGFIMGAVNFLLSYNRNDAEESCKNFQAVCKVQNLITACTFKCYSWHSMETSSDSSGVHYSANLGHCSKYDIHNCIRLCQSWMHKCNIAKGTILFGYSSGM